LCLCASENQPLSSYFPLKNCAFETSLLGISINLPWGGYGYFLELHIKMAGTYIARVGMVVRRYEFYV